MLSLIAAFVSVGAFFFSGLAIVVVATIDGGSSGSSGVAAEAAPIPVTLSEFKIAPAAIAAASGHVQLQITNSGSQTHNVSVVGVKKSPDIAAGKTGTLDLGELKAGTYQVLCEIPGHADSGMKATLTVTDGGAPSAGSPGGSTDAMAGMDHSSTDYAAMDKRMADGMKKGLDTFVKGNATKGVGNQLLKPTVEADGTKVFTLESSIIDWEVSPGKTVKAWAYNGMVPGPWIRTEPNDHVKVTIKNSLPVSTDIHFHGISTPFDMDGVAPLTQKEIAVGETYTYEWTNVGHSELGMYHAHDHGQVAVLNGMFAVFQVGDVVLPAGQTINGVTVPANVKPAQELPMVLNDAGVIGLSLNGKAYPATAPVVANPGDAILVHYYNEGLLAHPMHLHHVPQLVVAKDGFPLAQPYFVDTLNIAPGERYSVLLLPTTNDIGVWAWHCHILNHAENDDGLFGMVSALIVNDPAKKT
jgi:plastocyanin